MSKGWIGVDLDGTLAHYDGWKHHTHIGEPIEPMVTRVKGWLAQGAEVKIFTARISDPCPVKKAEITHAIKAWCLLHIGEILPITCTKDFAMNELWDDRARQVIPNKGIPVDSLIPPSIEW